MIRLEAVTKRFGQTVAVQELSFEVPAGEVCALVGPSGSGKTTTMRMINRLIEPSSGRIFLDGDDVTHVNPVELRRRVGYVIQQVGLFPHQTVGENVGTVPRLLGWDRSRTRQRTKELLELVGLDPDVYTRRYPAELSGGQRQRAGVARALAADPPVLLMDEPFGAIDPITRDRLQAEFLRLQRGLRKTVVFVTHDIDEAVKLGDRIAVLADGGRLEQYDTPAQVLGSPATPFVAEFVGADRGLKRLSVTGLESSQLEHPPVLAPGETLPAARAALQKAGAPWAVVVDCDGRLQGWVDQAALDECRGEAATVGDRSRPVEGTVPAETTLHDALARILQHDSGWVAVAEGDRYLGVLTPDSLHRTLRRSIEGTPSGGAGAGADAGERGPVGRLGEDPTAISS
jgi:osmoprotectant transport system ATP-binding protein